MTIVFLIVIGALAIFFLTPAFIYLCEDLGEFFTDCVESLKNAFIEAAEEWKDIFKRWTR